MALFFTLSVYSFQTVSHMCRILYYPLTHDDFHRDMPPAGGFEAVRYKRNLPLRGPSGLAILGGVTALCAYGFYRVGLGNIEKRCVLFRSVNVRTEPVWGTKNVSSDVSRPTRNVALHGIRPRDAALSCRRIGPWVVATEIGQAD